MKIPRALLALATILGLPGLASADDLYRLTFSGSARYLNERENVEASRLTATHLMARCVGTNDLGTNHPFQLVYNATLDRIQVVNSTNGVIMCDVLEFQNAYVNVNDRRSERLAFVFVPDQTNSVGSAVVYEKLQPPAGRISLSGRAQFALASIEPDSANFKFDDSAATNSNPNSLSTNPVIANSAAPLTTVASMPATGATGVPLPPGLPSSSGTSSSSPNVTTSPSPTNTVPIGQSPGTLLSATNNSSITDTNVPGLPGTSPGTLLNTTNNASTNPGTNTVGSTNGTGGITVPSVPTVPTVPAVPTINTPDATNALAATTTAVVTNIVICTGNFAAGRRLRVPSNGDGD